MQGCSIFKAGLITFFRQSRYMSPVNFTRKKKTNKGISKIPDHIFNFWEFSVCTSRNILELELATNENYADTMLFTLAIM